MLWVLFLPYSYGDHDVYKVVIGKLWRGFKFGDLENFGQNVNIKARHYSNLYTESMDHMLNHQN